MDFEYVACTDAEFEGTQRNPATRYRKSKGARALGEYKGLRVKIALVRDPDYDPKQAVKIGSAEDVFNLMQPLCNEAVETFWVLLLSAAHRVIGVYEAARGQVTSVTVTPSDVFRAALVAGAAAVILVHNHPSGDAGFSGDDRALSRRVVDAGKLLGINYLDHVIVSYGEFTSLAATGGL